MLKLALIALSALQMGAAPQYSGSPCIVTEVSSTVEKVGLLDGNGELWYIYGSGYTVGQSVLAVWNDNGTPADPYDDLIVSVWE